MCCRLGKWRRKGGALELCIGVKSSGKSVESVFALAAFLHPGPAARSARPCADERSVGHCYRGGIRTLLIAWITPFDAITSGFVTFERFTNTFEPDTRIRTLLPLAVSADDSWVT
jgi:hypothetical protein